MGKVVGAFIAGVFVTIWLKSHHAVTHAAAHAKGIASRPLPGAHAAASTGAHLPHIPAGFIWLAIGIIAGVVIMIRLAHRLAASALGAAATANALTAIRKHSRFGWGSSR